MFRIPEHFVARWNEQRKIRLPRSIDLVCPLCTRKVTFGLRWSSNDVGGPVAHKASRCPGCGDTVTFIVTGFEEDEKGTSVGEIFVYPAPKIRHSIEGLEEAKRFTKELKRAYASAISVHNVQEWTAAAVLTRRVLEGITKTLLPEEKRNQPLAGQIGELPKHVDLEAPIITLAGAVREGGNLGAHFDLHTKPDEEIVTLMLDLLDYLIEYLFVLPGRIEELQNRINKAS